MPIRNNFITFTIVGYEVVTNNRVFFNGSISSNILISFSAVNPTMVKQFPIMIWFK